jgi:hypothetical protein
VVGDQLVVGLVLTSEPTGGVVPISIEEYSLRDQAYTVPGPNNTTLTLHRQVQTNVDWSNTTVGAAGPRTILQFILTVPPAFVPLGSPLNLSVALLGVTFQLGIATPTTQLQVPQTYGQFLSFSAAFAVAAAVVFAAAASVAYMILIRVRYVPSLLKPAGLLGGIAFGFIAWVWADTRQAIFLLGDVSVFAVYAPLFLFSVLFWMALLPPRAYRYGVFGPVPELTQGMPGLDAPEYRIYRGDDGLEWVSERPWTALLRFLGVGCEFNPYVLSKTPAEFRVPSFKSIRRDLYAYFVVWDCRKGKGSIREFRPRIWWLPWRKSVREERAVWLREMKRDPAAVHVGVLVSADRGKLELEAGGNRTAAEAVRWPLSTGKEGRMSKLYEKSLNTIMDLHLNTQVKADELARKYTTIARIQERLSLNPEAVRQLDQGAAAKVLDLFGVEWEQLFPTKATAKEEAIRDEPKATPVMPSTSPTDEALNADPPWRRRGEHGGST